MEITVKIRERNTTDAQIVDDIRRVAALLGVSYLTQGQYLLHSKYSTSHVGRRLHGWDNALSLAGLVSERHYNVPDSELLENIDMVFRRVGKQASSHKFKQPLSKYHYTTYERRFGKWSDALNAYLAWRDAGRPNTTPPIIPAPLSRGVGSELRRMILVRDNYRCQNPDCTSEPGVALEVDHIMPRAKGGTHDPSNLEVLCQPCNRHKSDRLPKMGDDDLSLLAALPPEKPSPGGAGGAAVALPPYDRDHQSDGSHHEGVLGGLRRAPSALVIPQRSGQARAASDLFAAAQAA